MGEGIKQQRGVVKQRFSVISAARKPRCYRSQLSGRLGLYASLTGFNPRRSKVPQWDRTSTQRSSVLFFENFLRRCSSD